MSYLEKQERRYVTTSANLTISRSVRFDTQTWPGRGRALGPWLSVVQHAMPNLRSKT